MPDPFYILTYLLYSVWKIRLYNKRCSLHQIEGPSHQVILFRELNSGHTNMIHKLQLYLLSIKAHDKGTPNTRKKYICERIINNARV